MVTSLLQGHIEGNIAVMEDKLMSDIFGNITIVGSSLLNR